VLPLPARAQEPPRSAAEVIEQARRAAAEDRNAAAVELFEAALELAPAFRREVLREYADQLTYTGRAGAAVPLYREALAWELSPEEERRARLGLALALSWSDRTAQARMEYEALLVRDAGDVEARLGRARVLSWDGRLAEAGREYERVLGMQPGNREARRSLAQVQAWRGRPLAAMAGLEQLLSEDPEDVEALLILGQIQADRGRPERAAAAVDRLLAVRPDHARALEFRRQLQLRSRPASRLDVQRSVQSDDLSITVLALRQTAHFGEGRTAIELRFQNFEYERPGSATDRLSVRRPGLHLRHRLGDRSEVNVAGHLDAIDPVGLPVARRTFTYDAWYTLWPTDGVRVDLSSARSTFDDIRSLAQPVVATFIGASSDLTPDERTRLSGRANAGSFSDGNGRLWAQAEVERRLWSAPHLLVGGRATAMRFDERLDNGYFNPDRYVAAVATARAWTGWRQRTWVNVGATYGREQSTPGGDRPVWSGEARVNHWPAARLEVEGRYDYFSSRQFFALDEALAGGWARQTLGLSVRFLW
jgi:tetratricopeptide (TPR) repeat protein